MEIARYERRILAYLLDFFLSTGIATASWFFIRANWNIALPVVVQIIICEILGGFIYFLFSGIVLKWSNGYTIGSAIFATKVVHIDDRDISYRDAFLRAMGLAIFPWVLVNAAYMLIVHTERTIFDKMTNTIVIDNRHWK